MTNLDDLRRQIVMTMADMGYPPPRDNDLPHEWLSKLLFAFCDLQRRLP